MPRIAIPTEDGRLFSHFGRAREFSVFNVDEERRCILERTTLQMPSHTRCHELSEELKQRQVDFVIAGGIGAGAAAALSDAGIALVAGAPAEPAERVVQAYLAGDLAPGEAGCQDHDGHGGGACHRRKS